MPHPSVAVVNPFAPGHGTMPQHVAGRQTELTWIRQALRHIGKGQVRKGRAKAVDPTIVLAGPRGVGKTVLVTLAEQEAQRRKVRVVRLSRERMTSKEWAGRWFEPSLDTSPTRFKVKGSIENVGSLEYHHLGKEKRREVIEVGLERALKREPILIVLDEAHTVPRKVMADFCAVVQEFIRQRYPLAMVLAGTPGLVRLLSGMDATFMERSTRLVMNLLGEGEDLEAFQEGFECSGVSIGAGLLSRLASWSDRYPYFVQLVGSTTWQATNLREDNRVSPHDVDNGIEAAEKFRELFYTVRYDELDDADLLEHAVQVIKMSRAAKGRVAGHALVDRLMGSGGGMSKARAKGAVRKLVEHGFIHEVGTSYEAGIPSLHDYVYGNVDKGML